MELLGYVSHVESLSVYLEIVLVSVQDWWPVCARGTNGTPRCMVYAEHTISSEIILDAPDGTPR